MMCTKFQYTAPGYLCGSSIMYEPGFMIKVQNDLCPLYTFASLLIYRILPRYTVLYIISHIFQLIIITIILVRLLYVLLIVSHPSVRLPQTITRLFDIYLLIIIHFFSLTLYINGSQTFFAKCH